MPLDTCIYIIGSGNSQTAQEKKIYWLLKKFSAAENKQIQHVQIFQYYSRVPEY